MKKLLLIAFSFSAALHAQILDQFNLFNPLIQSYADMASSHDSRFQQRTGLHIQIPLQTKLNAGISFNSVFKVKVEAKQSFADFRFENLQSHDDRTDFGNAFNRISLGYKSIAFKGALKLKINQFNIQASSRAGEMPNGFQLMGFTGTVRNFLFRGYSVVGIGVLLSEERIVPVPVLGINYKLKNKWWGSIIFPAQAKLRYNHSPWLKVDMGVWLNGSFFDTKNITFTDIYTSKQHQASSITIGSLRTGAQVMLKANNKWRVYISGGWQTLNTYRYAKTLQYSVPGGGFARIALQYSPGKGLLNSRWADFGL